MAVAGLRLNLGCGPTHHDGEIGVDSEPTAACDVRASLLDLPYEAGAAAFVRMDHVLEHLPYRLAPTALREAFRVLAPGGTIHVGIPDLAGTCRAYLDAESLSDKAFILRHFYGSQAHAGEYHTGGWDKQTLRDLLESVGFVDVVVQPDPERSEGVCIQADGRKP